MISTYFMDLFMYNCTDLDTTELTIKTFTDIEKNTDITISKIMSWYSNIKDLTFKYFLLKSSENWSSIIKKSKDLDFELSLVFLHFLRFTFKNYSLNLIYKKEDTEEAFKLKSEKVYEYFNMYYKYITYFNLQLNKKIIQDILYFLEECQNNNKIPSSTYYRGCILLFLLKNNIKLNEEDDFKTYLTEAVYCFIGSTTQDYVNSYYELGLCYFKGLGFEKANKEHGLELIKLASLTHTKSNFYLGMIYEIENVEIAKKYYFESIETQESIPVLKLRELFKKTPNHLDIYMKLAEKKNEISILNLGRMFYYGILVEKNTQTARNYWLQIKDKNEKSKLLLEKIEDV